MTKIAIFPIPDCVSFPDTVFPLHVFEPRYRKMVKDCLSKQRPLAICHTEKELKAAKKGQDVKEALQSNQATYKPMRVFSAGLCELDQTLEDGRMYLRVNLDKRYQFVRELQTLPFMIAECEPLEDEPVTEEILTETQLFQEKVLTRLLALTVQSEETQTLLKSDEWQKRDAIEFSFSVFGLVGLEADLAQRALEMRSPVERLAFLLELLNQ